MYMSKSGLYVAPSKFHMRALRAPGSSTENSILMPSFCSQPVMSLPSVCDGTLSEVAWSRSEIGLPCLSTRLPPLSG